MKEREILFLQLKWAVKGVQREGIGYQKTCVEKNSSGHMFEDPV